MVSVDTALREAERKCSWRITFEESLGNIAALQGEDEHMPNESAKAIARGVGKHFGIGNVGVAEFLKEPS
jgi:hypothetical protein